MRAAEPLGGAVEGLHDWRDVPGAVRCTLQALQDALQASQRVVQRLEESLGRTRSELMDMLDTKADLRDLRVIEQTTAEAREEFDSLARRVQEEAHASLCVRKAVSTGVQAVRKDMGELQLFVERQHADMLSWQGQLDASLARISEECASALHAAKKEYCVLLQQELDSLSVTIHAKPSEQQVKEMVQHALRPEERQLARMKRLYESKVSAQEFAALAALAEGKVSAAELEHSVHKHVGKQLKVFAASLGVPSGTDVGAMVAAASQELREQLRDSELRFEEQKHLHEASMASLRAEVLAEVRATSASKLGRPEVEAVVAGALAEWSQAAQQARRQAAAEEGLSESEGPSFQVSSTSRDSTPLRVPHRYTRERFR